MNRNQEEYNRAIAHTLYLAEEDSYDDAVAFLRYWNEGEFDICERSFDYKVPDWLKKGEVEEPPALSLFPGIDKGHVDAPDDCDHWTAAIDITNHGAVIEVYGETEEIATARRDAIYTALISAPAAQQSEAGRESAAPEAKQDFRVAVQPILDLAACFKNCPRDELVVQVEDVRITSGHVRDAAKAIYVAMQKGASND